MATKHHEKDIEHFDQWASSYEESWLQRSFFAQAHQTALALAVDVVHQPASVLDVGCGTGKLLRRANSLWPEARLIGVDPAGGMIKVAKRLTPTATFFAGMAEALPLPDNSIDLALSTISFHHWQNQIAGIREIARVLRPGGCFILVDISFPDWLMRVFRVQHVHGPAQMRTLFKQGGLHVQKQQKIAWRRLATVGQK